MVVHPDKGILLSAKKKCAIKPWKRYGGILNACYQMKETNLNRLYTVWFRL